MHECCGVSSSLVCRWQPIHVSCKLFTSLDNYEQEVLCQCWDYIKEFSLEVRKEFTMRKRPGSLLLGCRAERIGGAAAETGQESVCSVSASPSPVVFLCLNPCSLPSAAPKTPTPSISSLPWHLSHLSLPHTSLPAAELLK